VRLPSQDRLTVTIHSFAYRNGIPKDFTGNGGGFVFDCRALTNPGKIEEFRYLSGLDGPVKEFLTKQPEVEQFLQSVFRLTDQQVTTYLERGFGHLMVSFGCTGGQHRSVFCAEQLAGHLKKTFHINIILEHTARKNWLLNSNL
jgi:RNase adaptor protein for sRNA GlmZ degradation